MIYNKEYNNIYNNEGGANEAKHAQKIIPPPPFPEILYRDLGHCYAQTTTNWRWERKMCF